MNDQRADGHRFLIFAATGVVVILLAAASSWSTARWGPSEAPSQGALEALPLFAPEARVVAVTEAGPLPLPRPSVRVSVGPAVGGGDVILVQSDHRVWAVRRSEDGVEVSVSAGQADGMEEVGWQAMGALVWSGGERYCWAEAVAENEGDEGAPVEGGEQAVAASEVAVVPVRVDVSARLYRGPLGAQMERAVEYVTAVWGAVAAIYWQDVGVRVEMERVVVWTDHDPFVGEDIVQQLRSYRAVVRAEGESGWALAQLLDGRRGGGGVAFLDGVCDEERGYAVSNLDGEGRFPVRGYVGDVDVVAHEVGHGLGSVHTHCYDPPIDRCYSGEPGCYLGRIQRQVGTIMSYCHLVPLGGKRLAFHPRVIRVMQARVATAACLPRERE